MPLKYDFDVLHLPALPAEDAPEGAGRTADGVPYLALFRSPATAAAISGADPEIRDYFKSCGFGMGNHDSGASDGCIPEDTAQDVISVCMRIKQNYGKHDLKGRNWNGFDFKAFVQHIKSIKVEVVRTDFVYEPQTVAANGGRPPPRAGGPSPLERVQLKYLNSVSPLGEFGPAETGRTMPAGPANATGEVRLDPGLGAPPRPHLVAPPPRKTSGVGVTTFLVLTICAVGAGGIALSNMRDTFFPEDQKSLSASKPKVESDIVGGARRIRIDY